MEVELIDKEIKKAIDLQKIGNYNNFNDNVNNSNNFFLLLCYNLYKSSTTHMLNIYNF